MTNHKEIIKDRRFFLFINCFLFAALILILPPTVQAATYYVDKNNPSANDSNAGTEAYPWKTLTKAGNTARAGDTVLVKAGTYNEMLEPANSGTAGHLITFKAYPGQECQGPYGGEKTAWYVKIAQSSGWAVLLEDVDYIRVEGFEISGSNSSVYLSYQGNSTVYGHEIVNNYIHDGGIGIYGPYALEDVLIENNEITNNNGYGMITGGDGLTIRANNIHYNDGDGIGCGGNDLLVEFNTIHDFIGNAGHEDGIECGDVTNSIFRYNTIYDFTQLIYFPLHNYDNTNLENVQIYGNLLYSIDISGAPAIFIDARNTNNHTISNIDIHSNTIAWMGFGNRGIQMYVSDDTVTSDIDIRDNILYETGIIIQESIVSEVTSDYNLFYSVGPPNFEGAHSIIVDPKFVDYRIHESWNFHLQPTSPAIDQGDPNLASVFTLPFPFKDIDGITRPQGSRYDIGAYEYQSGSVLYGDVSGDGEISAFDAALTARIAVGLDPLGDRFQVADVSGDGQVSAYDAALIAQRAVGLINKFPIE